MDSNPRNDEMDDNEWAAAALHTLIKKCAAGAFDVLWWIDEIDQW